MDWRKLTPAMTFASLAVLAAALCTAQCHAAALPDQMIYGGLEPDPVSDPGRGPARFEVQWAELPDQRTAQVYRISWWARIGSAHAAQLALGYVGLESEETYRYGGGRTSMRWTTRVGLGGRFGMALDAAGDLPLGDPTLFPLSARAPMGMFRGRVGLADAGPLRLWVGWWARRVSPPSANNRQDPLSGFASGSGYDALVEWRLERLGVDAMLHLPTGGPQDRAFHWSLNADWWFARDLALRAGTAFDTGPREDRSFDWQLLLGASWRPPREAPEG